MPGWALSGARRRHARLSQHVCAAGQRDSPFSILALSPNGRRLAFVAPDANGRDVLWVRELAALVAQPLADTEGAAGPFWSPDSRFIAFSAGGKLKKIDASGGPAIPLCDTNTSYPGSWGRGDVILFTSDNYRPVSRVAAAGGTPTPATTLDTKGGEQWHSWPFFLPDGRHFLYAAAGDPTSGVYVGSLDSPDRTRLLDSFANAQYASGFLVFPRAGTRCPAVRRDRLALLGEAMAVAEHVDFTGGAADSTLPVLCPDRCPRPSSIQDPRLAWSIARQTDREATRRGR